jgi:hypothetical protein
MKESYFTSKPIRGSKNSVLEEKGNDSESPRFRCFVKLRIKNDDYKNVQNEAEKKYQVARLLSRKVQLERRLIHGKKYA